MPSTTGSNPPVTPVSASDQGTGIRSGVDPKGINKGNIISIIIIIFKKMPFGVLLQSLLECVVHFVEDFQTDIETKLDGKVTF